MKNLTVHVLTVLPLAIILAGPLAMSDEFYRADTSACYSVPDADGRIACIARERGDRSMCYAIQRPDMRALCLAEVKAKK